MMPYLCSYQSTAASSSVAPVSLVQPSLLPVWLSSFSPPFLFFCCFLLTPPALDKMNMGVHILRKTRKNNKNNLVCTHTVFMSNDREKNQGLALNTSSIFRNLKRQHNLPYYLYTLALLNNQKSENWNSFAFMANDKVQNFSAATLFCFVC